MHVDQELSLHMHIHSLISYSLRIQSFWCLIYWLIKSVCVFVLSIFEPTMMQSFDMGYASFIQGHFLSPFLQGSCMWKRTKVLQSVDVELKYCRNHHFWGLITKAGHRHKLSYLWTKSSILVINMHICMGKLVQIQGSILTSSSSNWHRYVRAMVPFVGLHKETSNQTNQKEV